MAKIVAYKFVNPGGRSVRSSGGIAARKQLLAVNRVGASTQSLATTLSDIAKINTAFKRTETEIEKAQRRKLQRERDNQAEELQEGKSIEKGKVDGEFKKEIKKKPKGGLLKMFFEGTIQRKIKEQANKELQKFNDKNITLTGVNIYEDETQTMKSNMELYPFIKTKPRKTLIEPLMQKRLAEEWEQNRLKHE